jgi:hypothetical protein
VERYRDDGGEGTLEDVLAPLSQAARELVQLRERTGREEPTVIT